MTNAAFQREEYKAAIADWKLADDVIAGERKIKDAGEVYLPDPSDSDDDKAKVYAKYKDRASFYNATSNTLNSLIGAAYRKAPVVEIDKSLSYMFANVDGNGISIHQQSQAVLSNVLSKGRAGLLVDHPQVEGSVSRAQQEIGGVRASILHIDPNCIINWRTVKLGGVNKLSLVVIEETYEDAAEFGSKRKKQYRALKLVDGVYHVEIYRKDDKDELYLHDGFMPSRGNGAAWDEIPFTFVGAKNNDWIVDKAPLLDLALLNIKHYQVGADWYNALHYAGQPQPSISGLTQEWRDHLEEQGVTLGSRNALLLPEGGKYELVTAPADNALSDELKNIEERMVALGARLLQQGTVAKTATQSNTESETAHSILSLAAENVSNAYTKALSYASAFNGLSGAIEDTSTYSLNRDYVESSLDAQMLTALISAWQSGKLPESDLWQQLRRYGVIDEEKTDEEIKEELSSSDSGLGFD